MNLILLEPDELHDDNTVLLSGPRASHLLDVLRVEAGDNIRLGVLNGRCGLARVDAINNGEVLVHCLLQEEVTARPPVDLLLALPRPKVMRRLFAQCAALGVDRIMLTNAARVERHYFDTHVLTPACYRPLLIEGLQQARDTHLPLVSIHRQFRVLIEDVLGAASPSTMRVVAHPGPGATLSATVNAADAPRLLLALGPEGGWTDFELRLLESHGFAPISLGNRTLRSDTACVALLALAHDALGDRARRITAPPMYPDTHAFR